MPHLKTLAAYQAVHFCKDDGYRRFNQSLSALYRAGWTFESFRAMRKEQRAPPCPT